MSKQVKLSEAITSIRRPPAKILNGDQGLFEHEFSRKIDPVYLVELKKLLVSGKGVVQVSPFRNVPDVFKVYNIIYRMPLLKYLSLLLKIHVKRRKRTIHQPMIFVVDQWSTGYFHWICEVLPRLMVSREHLQFYKVALPHKFRNVPFAADSLKALGFSFEYLDPMKVYNFKRLLYVSHFAVTGNYHDHWIRTTSQALRSSGNCDKKSKRLYISRQKAERRRIINESEILRVLKKYDFDIIHSENMSFEEQRRLFSQCSVLISNHGAGLTNMVYMDPNSHVLEMRFKGDKHNNCYFSLAAALNIHYYHLGCKPAATHESPHTADIIVHPEAFDDLVGGVLQQLACP